MVRKYSQIPGRIYSFYHQWIWNRKFNHITNPEGALSDYEEFGAVHRLVAGSSTQLYISDPEVIHHILKNDKQHFVPSNFSQGDVTGASHIDESTSYMTKSDSDKLSKIILTYLSDEKFKTRLMASLKEFTSDFIEKIKESVPGEINMTNIAEMFAHDFVKSFCFGFESDFLKRDDFVVPKLSYMTHKLNFLYFIFPTWIKSLPIPIVTNLISQVQVYETKLLTLIERRKEEGFVNKTDLLSQILTLSTEKGSTITNQHILRAIGNVNTEFGHVMASCIAWAMYFLALHPSIQEKVRKDTSLVLSKEKMDCSDSLSGQGFSLLRNIVKETLRLRPFHNILCRHANQSVKIGSFDVDTDVDVFLDIFGMNRSKEIWGKDASTFRPDRFEETRFADTKFPITGLGDVDSVFGSILENQMTHLLVNLLEHFEFELGKHHLQIDVFGETVALPSRDIKVIVRQIL